MNENLRIVVIGGGTGTSRLLKEVKAHTEQLSVIVSMSDDGGGTGVLRREIEALAMGDVRQCLSALSAYDERSKFLDYRFTDGSLKGQSAGNVFLAALEKSTHSFTEAIAVASEMLGCTGKVIPVTLDNVTLLMKWQDGTVLEGEHVIDDGEFIKDPRMADLTFKPNASLHTEAVNAIRDADIVVIAPGDIYTSIGPVLATEGVGEALAQSRSKKVYICNIKEKKGHTTGFSVTDHADELERIAGVTFLDAVICNTPQTGADVGLDAGQVAQAQYEVVASDIRAADVALVDDGSGVKRSQARHDAKKVIEELYSFYNRSNM